MDVRGPARAAVAMHSDLPALELRMAKNESTARTPRLPGMPPPTPTTRRRVPAGTPAPAIQEAIAQMPHDYADDTDATEIDGPHVVQTKWLDSIETIPFDPSMRVSDGSLLGEGTPPHAVPPVRVESTPRPDVRRGQGTPRPKPRPHRAPAKHPHDNIITRLAHVDVAGGRVSCSQDPEQQPLAALPTPLPLPSIPTSPAKRVLHAPYGAPALPPHAPTAMALPPQAVMPTQIAQPLPAHASHSLPALARPYHDGVTPYPVPPWATGQHGAAIGIQPPIPQSAIQQRGHAHDHLDIYSDTDERHGETMRVAALPPSMPTPSLRPPLSRYLLPMIGGTALVVFVAGYFLVRGNSVEKAPKTAPVVAAAVAPTASAPIVTEIPVEKQLPDLSWKPRDAQPTIVAKTGAATGAPAEQAIASAAADHAADEIEMTPTVAPAKKKSSSSSARRAKRAQVAAVDRAKAKKVAPIAKPAKKSAAIAKSAKTRRDPILEEIARPTKSAKAKGTGPGKLVITSSVPTLIYVDGRSTNLMTPKTMNLTPGKHKITLLELKSRKAKTVDVEIASGTIAKLDKKF